MPYTYLWTETQHVADAQREYNRIIWQAEPSPTDFSRRFVATEGTSRHASVTRLDNDQVDWLSGLPDYIRWKIVPCSSHEEAIEHLQQDMLKQGFSKSAP